MSSHNQFYKNIFEIETPIENENTVSLVLNDVLYENSDESYPSNVNVNIRKGNFLNIFSFLTGCSKPGDRVIVYGSYHVPLFALVEFFPELLFELRDSGKIDERLRKNRKIIITNEREPLLQDPNEVILLSMKSMSDNRQNYDMIQPKIALMSFELGGNENIEYISGTLYVPILSTHFDKRTFLVPNGGIKIWSKKTYLDQVYTFQIDYRGRNYQYQYKIPGFDHCFDCAIEIAICEMYIFQQTRSFPTSDGIQDLMFKYSKLLL